MGLDGSCKHTEPTCLYAPCVVYICVYVDEDEDGDRITVCSDEELTAMLSYVSL